MVHGPTLARVWMSLIAAAYLACALPGRPAVAATPAPLGSTALYHWFASTAAHALRASEENNDLRSGGLLAINRSAASGLDQIEELAPPWLDQIDVRLTFGDDLTSRYGLSAAHTLLEDGRGLRIEALGQIDYDETGRTSGELGFGVENPLFERQVRLVVRGTLDQEWLRGVERYAMRGSLDWGLLRIEGRLFNETAMEEPSGALYEERLLDGYDLDFEAAIPTLPWLSVGTRQVWRAAVANDAPDVLDDRYSLRLRWAGPLEIETGSTGTTGGERNWFTQLRYQIALGRP